MRSSASSATSLVAPSWWCQQIKTPFQWCTVMGPLDSRWGTALASMAPATALAISSSSAAGSPEIGWGEVEGSGIDGWCGEGSGASWGSSGEIRRRKQTRFRSVLVQIMDKVPEGSVQMADEFPEGSGSDGRWSSGWFRRRWQTNFRRVPVQKPSKIFHPVGDEAWVYFKFKKNLF